MIIVVSAWRGPTGKGVSRRVREQSQAQIHAACSEIAGHVMRTFTAITIRYGDCPTGGDASFHALFTNPRIKRQLDRRNIRTVRYEADWSLPNNSGGPIRNNAMLDGDLSLDLHLGLAHLLIALPEPGPRKPHSGTWGCVDAAWSRHVPIHLAHLGEPDTYRVAGFRRTRMPLITPQDQLVMALEVAR